MPRRDSILRAGVVACFAIGCSNADTPASPARVLSPPPVRATIGSFPCDISYHAITQTDESELAPYGVLAITDTVSICEHWTGSDYSGEITQIGSSEAASDYQEDVKTVVYETGGTSAYDVAGNTIEAASGVGANSFEFVAATPDEQQASVNDPFYAIEADPNPVHCSVPPCPVQLRAAGIRVVDPAKPHSDLLVPLHRSVFTYLLRGMALIAPSAEGFLQFRRTSAAGEEVTLSIDPVTELIRRQETRTSKGSNRADLTWTLQNGKYVRNQMDITTQDVVGAKTFTSHTRVLLTDVRWDPSVIN